ncbi:MFS transporter [Nocardioides aurantiacus]|uniref:Putative MFS family arabinose efflux permease n=1 Tax=Nocardioides aurantiacus TaxID=86796 RepID=A0A3N2CPD0_9ACTN|nr:MFS transporter [Nocardioides aurantiacus]ROR89380.1 putative MFS family arabinose efflux permease [Nocardioides aurantiacus]
MRRPPLGLASLYGSTLLVQVVTFILRPTAIYRAIELDAPAQLLGAIGASFAVVPLLLAVGIGTLTDRLGEKSLMITGGVVLLGSTACFALLGSTIPGLLLATVTLGVGHLCSVVGQQAYVANVSDSSRYDTAFGHYTFAASAGQAAGPGFIALFGGRSAIPDTDAIFLASGAVAAALLLVTLALPRTTGSRGRTGDQGSVRTLLRRPGLVRALTVSSVVLAAVDISLVYLPALGAERDVSAATIGALLSVRAVFSMASRLFLGQLAALLGRGRLLVGSVAGAAVGMALLPAPLPTWSLFVVVAVMGFGLGVGQPMTMSWLADATPPGLRGRAMSLRLTGNRLGQVVVPTAAGAFAASAGAGAVLWATAAALGAVALAARRIRAPGT